MTIPELSKTTITPDEFTHEDVAWIRDKPKRRKGPYGEDIGASKPTWRCEVVSSITVVAYPISDNAIFSGWRVMTNGCGVSKNDMDRDEAFTFANRYAAEDAERRLDEVSIDLHQAEDAFNALRHIPTTATEAQEAG